MIRSRQKKIFILSDQELTKISEPHHSIASNLPIECGSFFMKNPWYFFLRFLHWSTSLTFVPSSTCLGRWVKEAFLRGLKQARIQAWDCQRFGKKLAKAWAIRSTELMIVNRSSIWIAVLGEQELIFWWRHLLESRHRQSGLHSASQGSTPSELWSSMRSTG